jgi:hypothetical protein
VKSDTFDKLSRSLGESRSRRDALRGFVTALGIEWNATRFPSNAVANKKNNKRKKPKNNEFGCLDVGKKCNGKDAKCCSGICNGKKPKKGKKDKSKCVGHNAGSCQAGFDVCLGVIAPCSTDGFCFQTTGKAPFCAGGTGICADCQKDTDCEALGAGPGAACIVCESECPQTGGTVCFNTAA